MRKEILLTSRDMLPVREKAEHELYEYRKQEITSRAEFYTCYAAFYEISPGKANYPYHYHTASTELFYIIGGEGILETPEGEKRVKAGDVIVCPPGERAAHLLRNPSETETLSYLDVDTVQSPEEMCIRDRVPARPTRRNLWRSAALRYRREIRLQNGRFSGCSETRRPQL